MNLVYVALSCVALVWFGWRQDLQGRAYPFVCLSCLYGALMLANGQSVPMDGVTCAVLSLSVWMLTSALWAEKSYSAMELLVWLSYLMLFMAARTIPIEAVMWIVLPTPSVLAALQLYSQANKKSRGERNDFPLFGNSNHNGSAMLVGLCAALWLSFNVSIYAMFFVILIGVAIAKTKCRGATIAMMVPFLVVMFMVKWEVLLYAAIFIGVFVATNRERLMATFRGEGLADRMEIYLDAARRARGRILVGRGLNYYRDLPYGRVHNDHLEIVGEIGLIGYGLFLSIFLMSSIDVFGWATLFAVFVSGLFFFPLREVHTAAPFWAMMGAFCASGGDWSSWILRGTGIAALLMVAVFVWTVFYHVGRFDTEQRREFREKEG